MKNRKPHVYGRKKRAKLSNHRPLHEKMCLNSRSELAKKFGNAEDVALLIVTIILMVFFLVPAAKITKLRTRINLCVGF